VGAVLRQRSPLRLRRSRVQATAPASTAGTFSEGRETPPGNPTRTLTHSVSAAWLRLHEATVKAFPSSASGLFELGRRAGAVVRASVLYGLVAWNDRGRERLLGSERRRNSPNFIQRLQRRAQERSRLLGLSFRGKRHGPGCAGSDWGRTLRARLTCCHGTCHGRWVDPATICRVLAALAARGRPRSPSRGIPCSRPAFSRTGRCVAVRGGV